MAVHPVEPPITGPFPQATSVDMGTQDGMRACPAMRSLVLDALTALGTLVLTATGIAGSD
jgi:hypothetical protein